MVDAEGVPSFPVSCSSVINMNSFSSEENEENINHILLKCGGFLNEVSVPFCRKVN